MLFKAIGRQNYRSAKSNLPFAEDRQIAKAIIGTDCFIEVFVDTSLACCVARDAKGLYKKALNGELDNFTGVSSPYEKPKKPNLILHTENQSPEETAQTVFSWLKNTIFFLTKNKLLLIFLYICIKF